jgi:hypothetical protein
MTFNVKSAKFAKKTGTFRDKQDKKKRCSTSKGKDENGRRWISVEHQTSNVKLQTLFFPSPYL